MWSNSSETAPLTSNLPSSLFPFGRKTFVAMCDHRCRFQSSNVYRTGKRIIRARHAITATDSFDALRRRTPPPPTPVAKPFCNRPNIDFIPVRIDRTKRDYPPHSLTLSSSSSFFIFFSLYISFFSSSYLLLSFSYVFHVFLSFCSSFSLSWIEIRHRGGCKMIFRNEICNRV